jgi:hypothetical protein
MALGSPAAELVLIWRWRPAPPPDPLQPTAELPPNSYRDDAAFRAAPRPAAETAAFARSFAQLARQTPDSHLYRLVQIFNTPLLSLTSRDAGRSEFRLWRGARPSFDGGSRWAYLWFFTDETDGDDVAVEFGFEGGLTLWSRLKDRDELARRYAVLTGRINAEAR